MSDKRAIPGLDRSSQYRSEGWNIRRLPQIEPEADYYNWQGLAMTWLEWTQSDLPCRFSTGRARDNADYLKGLLSTFLFGQYKDPQTSTNPLLGMWFTTGANAFLEMNSLAEDLRVIEKKQGMARVLKDLCDDRPFPADLAHDSLRGAIRKRPSWLGM